MATRLQSDDPGKQANWADIDDDDDDWAPESIEWTDGTKITLPQADEAPPPAPEPSPSPVLRDVKGLDAPKPKSPAPTQASASPTVKPSVFGSGRAGLVLKGASEKPTLVAKPPGPPTPVKSPWAALPPVDKVAPVAIEVQQHNQQPPQNRFNQRDPHGFHGMPPPAKEIAADDFSRTWRDGPSNTSRELYNSQSGRYEPVNDNRRGSVRNDQHSRGPALLHRPSPHDGPAEPSAAFQTHRAGGQDGGYGRRRTSSNVSGGSGAFVRRTSRGHDMPPPHEMLNARRGSLAAVSDAPSSPRTYSPSGQFQNQRGYQSQQWQSRASPVISHPSPQSAHGQPIPQGSSIDGQSQPPSAVLQEDPIEAQKKIMRATRELAIKRRQEEEAREEAARKERIRLKLEAMGPAPEKKGKKETPKEENSIPVHIQTRETAEATPGQSTLSTPEVGQDSNVKSSEPVDNQSTKLSGLEANPSDTRLPNSDGRQNGIHQGTAPSSASSINQPQENRASQQSWQNNSSSNDRFHSWGVAAAQQASSRNVWGPPSNDRTLGNGTFNPELSRLPEMSQSSSHPGPIGPPTSNRGNGQYQQGRGREYGSRPAPIAPPTRQTGVPRNADPRVTTSGWGNLPERIAAEDRQFAQQQDAELARRRELQEAGLTPEIAQPVYKDTWRQVTLNEDGTRSKVQASVTTMNDAQGNSSSWKAQDEASSRPVFEDRRLDAVSRQEVSQPQFGNEAWRSASNMNASPPVRGSRFFPNNNRDARLEDQQVTFDRPGSPTPPPPTMAGHPAYDGDIAHPHVSLPRPAPVVKLPPALAPIGPPKPASFAAAVTTPPVPVTNNNYQGRQDYGTRASYQDIRREQPGSSGMWQDKISSLLGRKNSPPKSHALAVDSSSKHSLELPTSQFTATVSLPSSVTGDLAADDSAVLSKPAAEECFEEQEMGSLPRIKVPWQAPQNAWVPAPQPKPMPRKFLVSQITSVDPLHIPQQTVQNGNAVAVSILLPGQTETKTVSVPNSRQRSNPRRGGSRGTPRHSSSSHPRGGRGRDSSSGFPSPSLDNASVSSSPTGRGGHRGNGRGYGGGNWNRHVSTPVHT